MSIRDTRFSASDLERLSAFSIRLRAFMAYIERHPEKTSTADAQARFAALCDEARLDMRVAVELPPGVAEPRNVREALRYMQRPRFCVTRQWVRTQEYVDRRPAEPRLLETFNRVVSAAHKLGVPLFPASLERRDVIHIGHATERFLPWACWDLIADWVDEAGLATGFRLLASGVQPGCFRLDPKAPELPDVSTSRRPAKLAADEAAAEREALWAYWNAREPGNA